MNSNEASLRFSVVVPVWNEAENIGPFCKRAVNELPGSFELLVCYDRDDDTTLRALDAIEPRDKPSRIRLIKKHARRTGSRGTCHDGRSV
jgi:glycosyltransferase involved in cell wall biosynthesis